MDIHAQVDTYRQVRDLYWSRYRRKVERHGLDDKRTIAARKLYVTALQRYYQVAAAAGGAL